jgi:hypothetical protein
MSHFGSPFERAEYYRERAVKLREMAETGSAAHIRERLLDLADQFERLADSVLISRQ